MLSRFVGKAILHLLGFCIGQRGFIYCIRYGVKYLFQEGSAVLRWKDMLCLLCAFIACKQVIDNET